MIYLTRHEYHPAKLSKSARAHFMKTDWWQVVNDLQALGLTKAVISKKIGRSQGWVMEIKNSGREPRYSDGAALLALLESCKGNKQ